MIIGKFTRSSEGYTGKLVTLTTGGVEDRTG